MSRLLENLDQAFAQSRDPVMRAELLAKRSRYTTRVGRFAETRAALKELRLRFGDGSNGRVMVLIMLSEGLLHYYEELSPVAIDRVMRAQALAIAMGDRPLIAIASSWKAHLEFEASKFELMIASLRLTLDHAAQDDHEALARAAMTLTDCFIYCGDRLSAQKWFMDSRDHALAVGDQAGIDALLNNRALLGVARLRAKACFQSLDDDEVKFTRQEVSSALNFQHLIAVRALTNYGALCSARLMILEKRYEEAIVALESLRDARPFAEAHVNHDVLNLEIAFCLFFLGQPDEARIRMAEVRLEAFENLDIDEKLVAYWMQDLLGRQLGIETSAATELERSKAAYEQMRLELLNALRPFAST